MTSDGTVDPKRIVDMLRDMQQQVTRPPAVTDRPPAAGLPSDAPPKMQRPPRKKRPDQGLPR